MARCVGGSAPHLHSRLSHQRLATTQGSGSARGWEVADTDMNLESAFPLLRGKWMLGLEGAARLSDVWRKTLRWIVIDSAGDENDKVKLVGYVGLF